MQGIEAQISDACDGKVPCVPPSSNVEVGTVLLLNKQKNPARENVNMDWFSLANNCISDLQIGFEEKEDRQRSGGNRSSHRIISLSIRALKGNVKFAVINAFGLGAAAGANNNAGGVIKLKGLQKFEATNKLKGLLNKHDDVASMIQREAELNMHTDDPCVLAVVESVYKANIDYDESSDGGVSASANAKAKAADQGGSAEIDAKAEDRGSHQISADSSTVGFGVYFYKVWTVEETLFMSKPAKLLRRTDPLIREAMSWARCGPVAKANKRQQLIMLHNMKKCAHYVPALHWTESAETYSDAKKIGLKRTKEALGIDGAPVKTVGVAVVMSPRGDGVEEMSFETSSDNASKAMDDYLSKSPESRGKDDEMMDDDLDTAMESSVTLIRSEYGEESLTKLYDAWIKSNKNLALRSGWMLKEVRICVFVDVEKSLLVPVTLRAGEDPAKAPGSVFRYLESGDYLTVPVIGGPEKLPGSQRRMFGNYESEQWRIGVSTKFLDNDRDPSYASSIEEGFYEVKREPDDIDWNHKNTFVKLMRYTLLNSSTVAQGDGERIGAAAAETKEQPSRPQASLVSPAGKKQRTEDA